MGSNKILIVEDEVEFAGMMKIRLQLAGYDPAVVTDTQSGVNAVLQNGFRLIVLDLMMPGGGGFALLEQIRSVRQSQRLPVVIVTGKTLSSDVQAMVDTFKVDAVFTKPYSPDRFVEKVRSLAPLAG